MDVNEGQKDNKSMAELEDEELCEALAVLAGSDPDNCSYPRVRFLLYYFLIFILVIYTCEKECCIIRLRVDFLIHSVGESPTPHL